MTEKKYKSKVCLKFEISKATKYIHPQFFANRAVKKHNAFLPDF